MTVFGVLEGRCDFIADGTAEAAAKNCAVFHVMLAEPGHPLILSQYVPVNRR